LAYDTALNIISDAAAELGLGTVADAYGSTDPNIIQLRGMLKSMGRDLVRDRDWTHLIKEYSFVTRPNWAKATAYTRNADAWISGNTYSVGNYVTNAGNLYQCVTAGTSDVQSGAQPGPNTTSSSIPDGSCVWKYLNAGSANIVTHGLYYYTCTQSGTSGAVGPYGASAGVEYDGSGSPFVQWTFGGNAADYSLPSDFNNMIDQTGWNRTNRLPVGGPVDGQVWQYLKGRQQGVVFNVLFRPVANVLRLYPDTDTPGGYNIVFEYVSNSWVSATGGTTPTTDQPTANTDIIYFDQLLVMRGLKLAWLKAKGFPTEHAQRQYDECEEEAMNADGSAEVLNLRGRGPYDPLIGLQNVPITGFGS